MSNLDLFRRHLGMTPHIAEGRATFNALVPDRYKRRWSWVEPGDDGEPVAQTITEDEILATYYPMWAECLRRLGRENLISTENCIEDFVTVHWAQEV